MGDSTLIIRQAHRSSGARYIRLADDQTMIVFGPNLTLKIRKISGANERWGWRVQAITRGATPKCLDGHWVVFSAPSRKGAVVYCANTLRDGWTEVPRFSHHPRWNVSILAPGKRSPNSFSSKKR